MTQSNGYIDMNKSKEFQPSNVDLKQTTVLHDGFLAVEKLSLTHDRFDGQTTPLIEREVCLRGDAVAVIAYDPEKDVVVMVEQFRPGVFRRGDEPWLIEIVAGMRGSEEDELEVANRELKEETGLEALSIHRVMHYFTSPGGCDERLTLFFATVDATQASQYAGLDEEDEDIRIHVLPYDKVVEMMAAGQLDNATSLIAIQWLMLNRQDILSGHLSFE